MLILLAESLFLELTQGWILFGPITYDQENASFSLEHRVESSDSVFFLL